MPSQHVEIAETLSALKRKLKREREAPSDQPISSATNRGNKLKKGARYVHAGSLPFKYGPGGYKEKVEHAGFTRYILDRNPKRFNEMGDELDDSESDPEADADAEEENPYAEVRLEELLRPLTHPAELANHPTLSQPYIDNALPDMVKNTEEKLREERANLWRAKNLYRHFIGDESWINCERLEAPEDWDLFEPHAPSNTQSPSKKRKLEGEALFVANGIEEQDHAAPLGDAEAMKHSNLDVAGSTEVEPVSKQERGRLRKDSSQNDEDVNMIEEEAPTTNGVYKVDTGGTASENAREEDENQSATAMAEDSDPSHKTRSRNEDGMDGEEDENGKKESSAEDTPPPPPRRITRALAAEVNNSNAPTPPLSPTTSSISNMSSSMLQPAPLFLLPPSLYTAHATHPSSLPLSVAHSGLPVDEIIETRKLLGMYIQKQEECIRGLEGMLGKLIKAKRRRDLLWDWCKAEGHVGEMSDGEDWIDTDQWGLKDGELRKGKDEDEQNQEEEVGRKGKRRRARE